MIRALKILGDISLASIDRGMRTLSPKIEEILKLTNEHIDTVDYEDLYYKNFASNTENIDYSNPKVQNS